MATKPKSPAKPKQPSPNTSAAAVPGNSADVLAKEAVQAASPVIASLAGHTSSDEAQVSPPVGAAKALIVSAKAEGFRRAGRRWTVEAQTVDIDDFSLEQIAALLGEAMLDVVVVTESAGDTDPGVAGNI